MALRGAVFASCIGRQRSPSLISLPTHFRTKFHGSLSHIPHSFNPHPNYKIAFNPYGLSFTVRSIQGTTIDPVTSKKEGGEQFPENLKIKMLYDGDCPLCMREVNMLRERNERYRTIKFVDISSEDYSPAENQGLDYKTVMGRIHAILSDGTVVTDVEAFRRLYEEVGLGWVYAITKYEPIGKLADAIYGVWAKYRLPITGRPSLEEILEARKKKDKVCNDSNSCKM